MGNYNLKSGIFRCENCFSIYKMSIDPGLPESYVNLDCKCCTNRTSIKNFLSELSKGSKPKIKCNTCRKKEDKNWSYCHDCDHIFCHKCINKEHQNHKYISLLKLDFNCIFHQKENFCAYCKDCEINLCQICLDSKTHLSHDVVEFNKILMNKTERDFLKDKFTLAQEKLVFNNNFVNKIAKKMPNKEDAEKLINLEKDNSEQNKIILELINFFMYVYDNSKVKNYNIIINFVENVNLNVNKFKFWNTNIKIEDALEKITKYFNTDFIVINTGEEEDLQEEDIDANIMESNPKPKDKITGNNTDKNNKIKENNIREKNRKNTNDKNKNKINKDNEADKNIDTNSKKDNNNKEINTKVNNDNIKKEKEKKIEKEKEKEKENNDNDTKTTKKQIQTKIA